ncbi:MAG TPA: methyltransferase domain-containing protein, partial [Novosphingobium sp.]|nr:methyltransferase domain-containing protein [Novosphingobium sp.]
MAFDFGKRVYDVVVTLEVLAHVADQAAFVAKLAKMLKPGGMLVLATQNRHVLQEHNRVPAPIPGQIRQWVDRTELVNLLQPHFALVELRTITPQTNKGLWR